MRNTKKLFIITLSTLLLFLSSCVVGRWELTKDAETEAITELNTTYWETLESVKPSENPSSVTDIIEEQTTVKTQDNVNSHQISKEEETLIAMFRKYGTYDYESGTYKFTNIESYDPLYLIQFVYYPTNNSFSIGASMGSIGTDKISSVHGFIFMWGDLVGYSGTYVLYGKSTDDIIATIEFKYPTFTISESFTSKDYTYEVTKNTFTNLKDEDEIAEYAQKSAEMIFQGALYAQSIVSQYTDNITLW